MNRLRTASLNMKLHLILYFIFVTTNGITLAFRTGISIKKTQEKDIPLMALSPHSFIDLYLNGNIFVDKTLLIKEVLQDNNKLILITRPRFWGKSINLDMIKTFLEIPSDKFGNPVPPDQYTSTNTYRMFVERQFSLVDRRLRHLKKLMIIASEKKIINKYLCKYPVIYVNFSHIRETFMNPYDAIKVSISETYRKHQYVTKEFHSILNNNQTPPDIQEVIQDRLDFFSDILYNTTTSCELLMKSLKILSEILHNHFNTRVFIMIDEYDAPFHIVFSSLVIPQKDKDQMLDFYTNFLVTSLKNNVHLEKAILTGKLPLTIEDLAEGLNMAEYTFLNDTFMEFYGINSDEIDALGQYEKLNITKNITQEASRYGYYQFPAKNLTVYNPKVIANILADKKSDILNTRARENLVRFFASSGVEHFIKLHDLFNKSSTREGFISINNDCRHYSRHEIQLFYIGMTFQYNLSVDRGLLLKMNNLKFSNKISVFLYMLGHLSIFRIYNDIIYLVDQAKDHLTRERYVGLISRNISI